MFTRNDRHKLSFNHLDMQILFDSFYEKCQTEEEVEWVKEQIEAYLETGADEAIENL